MSTGVIKFRSGTLIYEVSDSGHLGGYIQGKPVAIMPDMRRAIIEDMEYQRDKGVPVVSDDVLQALRNVE